MKFKPSQFYCQCILPSIFLAFAAGRLDLDLEFELTVSLATSCRPKSAISLRVSLPHEVKAAFVPTHALAATSRHYTDSWVCLIYLKLLRNCVSSADAVLVASPSRARGTPLR